MRDVCGTSPAYSPGSPRDTDGYRGAPCNTPLGREYMVVRLRGRGDDTPPLDTETPVCGRGVCAWACVGDSRDTSHFPVAQTWTTGSRPLCGVRGPVCGREGAAAVLGDMGRKGAGPGWRGLSAPAVFGRRPGTRCVYCGVRGVCVCVPVALLRTLGRPYVSGRAGRRGSAARRTGVCGCSGDVRVARLIVGVWVVFCGCVGVRFPGVWVHFHLQLCICA